MLFDKGAEVVVCFCNHCNSSSPTYATDYLRWRKKHHPQSRQQVVVLHQGMRGLQCRLAELGREKEMLVRI